MDNADADHRHADAGRFGFACRRLPLDADAGHEVAPARARFVQFLVTMRTVIADRGGADDHLPGAAGLLNCLDDVGRTLHSTDADELLVLGRPTLVEDAGPGEVHDRVALGDAILPRAGYRRVAED